jgi:hypothetical protein
LRVRGVELTGLDERGDGRPVGAALVASREQRILAVERDRAHRALDRVDELMPWAYAKAEAA